MCVHVWCGWTCVLACVQKYRFLGGFTQSCFISSQSISVAGGFCWLPAFSLFSLFSCSIAFYSSELEGCVQTYGAWHFNYLLSPWFISIYSLPTEVLRKHTIAGVEQHQQSKEPSASHPGCKANRKHPHRPPGEDSGLQQEMLSNITNSLCSVLPNIQCKPADESNTPKENEMCWAQQGPEASSHRALLGLLLMMHYLQIESISGPNIRPQNIFYCL